MLGSFCLICVSLIVSTLVPHVRCQSHEPEGDDSLERQAGPHGSELEGIQPNDPRVRLKGLCRDGWLPGTMKDFSGKEIPVCLKINPEALTWTEAQASCRKDYGFLMKYDSRATIDDRDLLTSVLLNGVTQFWTGMHSENGHLIWDDLIPNQVRPHNRLNDTSVPERPWTWENSIPDKNQQYCGKMNVQIEDDRRRRKRSSDDDSNDGNFPAFDLSNFQNRMFNNNFRRINNAFPQTSAFQSMLSRTQMSDQLELPGTLGLQSERQIPGSGLSEANIQNGGLATGEPTFELNTNFEQSDSETVSPFGNLNMGDSLNTESNENSMPSPAELLKHVKEVAAKIEENIGTLSTPSPTEAVETLRNLIQENAENFRNDNADSFKPENIEIFKSDNADRFTTENADSAVTENLNSFGSGTTVIPPSTGTSGRPTMFGPINSVKTNDASVKNTLGTTVPSVLADKMTDDSNKAEKTETKAMDIVSSLAGDNTQTLDATGANRDETKVKNELIDNGLSDKLDFKEKDVTISLGNEVMNENSKVALETVAHELKNTADVSGPEDVVASDDSLGIGQLTDFLTNEAIKEALNNINENKDSNEEIVSTPNIDAQTKLDGNNPIGFTSLSDGGEGTLIGNINSEDTVTNINEKLENVFENLAEKSSNLLGDLENVSEKMITPETSIDFHENTNLNAGLENQEDVTEKIEEILPDISSLTDAPVSDKSDLNDILIEGDSSVNPVKDMQDDVTEILNDNDGTSPFEVINEVMENLNVNHDIDAVAESDNTRNEDEVKSLENDSSDLIENLADAIETHDDKINEKLVESVNNVQSLIDNDNIESDDTAEAVIQEGIIPEVEREPVNTDYFEDMTERLGNSEDLKGTEEDRNVDTDRVTDVIDDTLDYTKDASEKLFDQDLLDRMTTDSEKETDKIENDKGLTGSVFDKSDDGQTKRDSDWSEFDWNSNEQENVNIDPSSEMDVIETEDVTEFKQDGDFDHNDGNSDLYEKFETENKDNKDFIQKQDYVTDVFDDLHDKTEDALGSDKDTESKTEIESPNAHFEDKENERHDDFGEEKETELPESHFHDKKEETQKDTEVETELDDSYFGDKEERQTEGEHEVEIENSDSNFDASDELEHFDEIPDLAEDVVESDQKIALAPEIKSKDMQLSSCEVRLPSVCFSYEVEVMDKASTCENGWYGHVLLDTCYRVLETRLAYRDAVAQCQSMSARLVLASSEFERKFILIAVQKDGKLFKGAKFWMETVYDKMNCKYFDERGVHVMENCNTQFNAVCVKDAKSLSVYTTNNLPVYGGDVYSYYESPAEQKTFVSKREDNKLPCELSSAASEFPVLWFKDGVLVETKDKYVSTDISLYLNAELVSSIAMVTDRDLATPALQGQYWCEVWDRQTLTRKRSKAFNVRFSDIISFHGSMELPAFSQRDELLFNMANRKFPEMSSAEIDIKKVFTDVLPMLQARFPEVTDVFTYIDGIRSNQRVIEYHAYFTLNRDYTLQDEDIVYNRLKALLRTQLGNRYYMASLPGQTTLSTFRTMSLQSTVSCPAATLQTTIDLYGRTTPVKVFSFPKVGLGEYANSIENCSITNRLPSGSARCLGDFYTGAYWGEVVAHDCIEEAEIDQFNNEIWGASPYTEKLTEFAEVTVDARNAEKLVSEVAQIAKVAQKFTPTDINKIADVLDHTTQVRSLPQRVGEDVLKTIDRLMTISEKEAHVANVETKAANRIIKSLERYAENADIGTKDQVRLVSDNVVVEIWNLNPNVKPVIGLAAETRGTSFDKPFKTETIATVFNKSQLYEANVDAAIELPTEIFNIKEKGGRITDRLTMMVFRKSKLFKAAITDGGRQMNPTEQQLSNLNSYVISASIAGKKLQDLTEKVKTIFKPIKDVESGRSCVWWDFDMNNFKGGWSDKGCVYDGKVNGRDVCLCDHLTNFAVLIDFYGQAKPIPDHHELSLSIISVLGLSCSILGLSLTIISYLFFRKLRQGRAQQTLFNLSLSLLMSMLVFLVGVKQTHSYYGCITVAILLHYLILVSFMWMLMEAILQYLTFVKILGTYITRFTLKTVLPAWGLPLIPVIAVLCIDYTLYKGGPNYCWMGLPAFYYAFAVPVTGIILVNVIIFIVTIVSIFRRGKGLRSNQKKQKMAMTNLQAAITSFILLGLTWIFGYLAISDARLPFQYVFTILNSLQGFFIFILFVVRKKKVREQWYFICCKGVEKDRVSRSLSASNSIPSTYSNGSNRDSRKDGRDRDRSDSTKTVQSTYSNSSNGFTNYGYDHGYDFPFSRYDRRAFRKF